MTIHGTQSRHWASVGQRFAGDAALVFVSFYVASVYRFGTLQPPKFSWYLPNVALASVLLPSLIYILGLYATESLHHSRLRRSVLLLGACTVAMFGVLAYGSLDFTARVGRGVLGVAVILAVASVWIHHMLIQSRARSNPMRMGFLIFGPEDEEEARRLMDCEKPHIAFVGFVTAGGYQTAMLDPGMHIGGLETTRPEHLVARIDTLICNSAPVQFRSIASAVRQLRYRGMNVIALTDAFEELFQMVPLEIVDDHWLLQVSALPGALYVKKVKRAFDVITSLALLVVLGPVCLLAMLCIRLGSKGPVIFRQERCGRFGKTFILLKLRSMRTDAEADGPQWSQVNDRRVTWFGRFLRKYRIDEIPQLINVLRGDMSIVGPRPERPEFAAQIEREVPLFSERLMLQPGITGWAQVRYPYGSTVDDARRKLEHDLYYLKHMSLFLDLFILLDTVQTVLGGVRYSTTHAPAALSARVPGGLAGKEAASEH